MASARVVGLGGSLASASTSRIALERALAGAERSGATTERFDVAELDLPMFRPGAPAPASLDVLLGAIREANGMIWSSPLYHGTVSGAFKNAIDWLQLLASDDPPYLADKPVGLIAAAGGTHGLQAINTMGFMVRALRGIAVPLVVPVARASQAIADGQIVDAAVDTQLLALGSEVARLAGHFARPPAGVA